MAENSTLPVGCVIMASGLAKRFGSNKLLAPFDGQPLLCRAFAATDTSSLTARVVVTRSAEIEALCTAHGIPCVRHTLPGRNDTVRLGLEFLLAQCPELTGCMFLPGDQPLLRQHSVRSIVSIFRWDAERHGLSETERSIFRLGHRFKNDPIPLLGSPVLFGRAYFPALCSLPAGKGGGVLIRQHPDRVHAAYIGDHNELRDADTPEALQELEVLWKQRKDDTES